MTVVVPAYADPGLLVEHNTEQGTMYSQATVVLDEAKLFEFVEENVHMRARCTDHLRRGLLTYAWDQSLRPAFLPKASQHQERSC